MIKNDLLRDPDPPEVTDAVVYGIEIWTSTRSVCPLYLDEVVCANAKLLFPDAVAMLPQVTDDDDGEEV